MAFLEVPRTNEEILLQGEQAANLLNSPTFNLGFRTLIQEYQDDWLSTQPQESAKRESLYLKAQVAGDVASDIAQLVSDAQRLNLEEIQKEERLQSAYDESRLTDT